MTPVEARSRMAELVDADRLPEARGPAGGGQ